MGAILSALVLSVAALPFKELQVAQSHPTGAIQGRLESNVVFGMYSGLALLMDIHYPEKPNGYGIIDIPGSAFRRPLSYAAPQLKETSRHLNEFAKPLISLGYTVFVINHRSAPRFRYPAAVEDAQRAVRFVRYNARKFGIYADRIGGIGHSSGANLITMLGVLDGSGDSNDPDVINRESARLQCVIALAPLTDFTRLKPGFVVSYLGVEVIESSDVETKTTTEYKTYWEASPLSHVSRGDAPLLLIHGDADRGVPIEQSELMEQAMQKAGVPVKLMRIVEADHWLQTKQEHPGLVEEMTRWFDRYLRVP
jgi:acetyl esterase/lipase